MQNNILFFDGVCGLCNKSVDFLIRIDKKKRILYAPLQGETAKIQLPPNAIQSLDSIVFQQNGKLYTKSDAALKVLYTLGGSWKLSGILFILPKVVRDVFYSFIARYRYVWFGKKETCRIPTKEERDLFLP